MRYDLRPKLRSMIIEVILPLRGSPRLRLALVRRPRSALQTARIVRLALEPALGVEEDLVVDRRARAPRGLEAQAQLAALDRLDRAERLREPTVEPAVPLHVGAEPHGAAEGDDLEHAPERAALLSSGVARLEHRR